MGRRGVFRPIIMKVYCEKKGEEVVVNEACNNCDNFKGVHSTHGVRCCQEPE